MESNFEIVLDKFKKMNTRDLILIAIYLTVFSVIGILFKLNVIPYPENPLSLVKDIYELSGEYIIYTFIFVVLFSVNGFTFWSFTFAENGCIKHFKREMKGDYDYDYDYENLEEEKLGSFLSILVSGLINMFLFTVYLPIYISLISICVVIIIVIWYFY